MIATAENLAIYYKNGKFIVMEYICENDDEDYIQESDDPNKVLRTDVMDFQNEEIHSLVESHPYHVAGVLQRMMEEYKGSDPFLVGAWGSEGIPVTMLADEEFEKQLLKQVHSIT